MHLFSCMIGLLMGYRKPFRFLFGPSTISLAASACRWQPFLLDTPDICFSSCLDELLDMLNSFIIMLYIDKVGLYAFTTVPLPHL